jgi:hypothetical protein
LGATFGRPHVVKPLQILLALNIPADDDPLCSSPRSGSPSVQLPHLGFFLTFSVFLTGLHEDDSQEALVGDGRGKQVE